MTRLMYHTPDPLRTLIRGCGVVRSAHPLPSTQLDAEKKVYIEKMVRGWELDATVDTADSVTNDGSAANTADAAAPRVAAKPGSQSQSQSASSVKPEAEG